MHLNRGRTIWPKLRSTDIATAHSSLLHLSAICSGCISLNLFVMPAGECLSTVRDFLFASLGSSPLVPLAPLHCAHRIFMPEELVLVADAMIDDMSGDAEVPGVQPRPGGGCTLASRDISPSMKRFARVMARRTPSSWST